MRSTLVAVVAGALLLLIPSFGSAAKAVTLSITISGSNSVTVGTGQTCLSVNVSGMTPNPDWLVQTTLEFTPNQVGNSFYFGRVNFISGSTGMWCYTPSNSVTSPITIHVTGTTLCVGGDCGYSFTSNTFNQTWNPPAPSAPTLPSSLTSQTLTLGAAVDLAIATANGGPAPTDFSLVAISPGLPPGLAYGNSTGHVTGKPTLAGTYQFTVSTTKGAPLTRTYSWKVVDPAAVPDPDPPGAPAAPPPPPNPGALAVGLGSSNTASTSQASSGSSSAGASILTAASARPVVLAVRAPAIGLSLSLTKPAQLKFVLLDSKGKTLAKWARNTKAGKQKLMLALPKQARHQGRRTLHITSTGADAVKPRTLVIVLRSR